MLSSAQGATIGTCQLESPVNCDHENGAVRLFLEPGETLVWGFSAWCGGEWAYHSLVPSGWTLEPTRERQGQNNRYKIGNIQKDSLLWNMGEWRQWLAYLTQLADVGSCTEHWIRLKCLTSSGGETIWTAGFIAVDLMDVVTNVLIHYMISVVATASGDVLQVRPQLKW